MPKYKFEGRLIRLYTGEVEADSEEAAIEEIEDGMVWDDFDEDMGPEAIIDWIGEVED